MELKLNSKKSSFRWVVLFVGFVLELFAIGMGWTCMATLYGEISKAIPMTYAQWGVVWGMVSVAMMLFSIPGGMTADRVGIRRCVGVATIVLGLIGGGRGLTNSFLGLSIMMFLFGVSMSFLSPNLPKAIGLWFSSDELGLANGVLLAGYVVGGALSVMFSGTYLISLLGGWRDLLWCYGIASALLGVVWLIVIKDPPSSRLEAGHGERAISIKESFLKVIRIRDQWLLLGAQFCLQASLLGLIGFLPDILVGRGMSKWEADLSVSLIFWTNILGVILIPLWSDKVGLRKIFIWPLALLGAICICLFGTMGQTSLMIACAILGLLVGFIPLFVTLLLEMEGIGPMLSGTALGIFYAIGNLGAFVSPVIGGVIMDVTGVNWSGFLFWGFLLASVAIFILPVREKTVSK